YQRVYRLPSYDWLRFLEAAALGDYDPAAESLSGMLRVLQEKYRDGVRVVHRALPIIVATDVALSSHPANKFLQVMLQTERGNTAYAMADLGFLAAQRADLHVVNALLAVERGLPAAALRELDAAFAAAAEHQPPVEFATRHLASHYRLQIQRARGAVEVK